MTSQTPHGSQELPLELVPSLKEIEEHFSTNLTTIVSSYFEMKKAALADGRTEEEAEVIAMTWVVNRSLGVYSSLLKPKLAEAFAAFEQSLKAQR